MAKLIWKFEPDEGEALTGEATSERECPAGAAQECVEALVGQLREKFPCNCRLLAEESMARVIFFRLPEELQGFFSGRFTEAAPDASDPFGTSDDDGDFMTGDGDMG